jgi:hypothetical protein
MQGINIMSLGCYKKTITDCVAYIQQTFIYLSSGSWKSKIIALAVLASGYCCSRISHAISLHSQMVEETNNPTTPLGLFFF